MCRWHHYLLRAVCCLIFFSAFVQQKATAMTIHPNILLLKARQQQTMGTFHARLREESHAIPFRIVLNRGVIRYEFAKPSQTILLKLGEKCSETLELKEGHSLSVRGLFDRCVRGTSVTYEDLALSFLYWPNPIVVGEDTLHARSVWILQMNSPRSVSSRYGTVFLWIDKKSGALLRIVAFDRQRRCLKRFEVVSWQAVHGHCLLKEMRIEECNPLTGKVHHRAYLELSADQT